MQKKNGFTLMELLVVVLIIGILAAVAVPQFQLAIAKSRYVSMMALVDACANAQERYKLANGDFASSFDVLDISLPRDFICDSNAVHCGNEKIHMVIEKRSVHAALGDANTGPRYLVHYQFQRKRKCMAGGNSDLWNKVCQSLGGILDPNAGASVAGYWKEYGLP